MKNILAENMRRFNTKNLSVLTESTADMERAIETASPPDMAQFIADWVMSFGSQEAFEAYLEKLARSGQPPLFIQKILDFLNRNKSDVELRNKQIAKATRSYNLQQASDSPAGKVAKKIGVLTFDALWIMLANKVRKGLQNKKEQ
jgi:hypothetical protein